MPWFSYLPETHTQAISALPSPHWGAVPRSPRRCHRPRKRSKSPICRSISATERGTNSSFATPAQMSALMPRASRFGARANSLIFVRMNQCPMPSLENTSPSKPSSTRPHDVNARHASLPRLDGADQLRHARRVQVRPLPFQHPFSLINGQLTQQRFFVTAPGGTGRRAQLRAGAGATCPHGWSGR